MLHYNIIVIHAYEVSLAASKEQEQLLRSELDTTKHASRHKDQRISKLEEELQVKLKEMAFLADQLEQQQNELEMLQQKCKYITKELTVNILLVSLFSNVVWLLLSDTCRTKNYTNYF